jgi:hypothetical protein
MIPAGLSELRRAFHSHSSVASDPSPSRYLLLFYAAECGLKLTWLRHNKLLKSEDFPQHLRSRGHDLVAWAKALRLPAQLQPELTRFRLKRGSSETHGLDSAHQAWRYGVELEANDEHQLVDWLEKICRWVREGLSR